MHRTPTAALNKLSLLLILIIKKINNESFINDRLESMRILPKEKKKKQAIKYCSTPLKILLMQQMTLNINPAGGRLRA